jgi:beta-galactosidase
MTFRAFSTALLLLLAFAVPFPAVPTRQVFNFNAGWKLLTGDPLGAEIPAFDDTAWRLVTLPHA